MKLVFFILTSALISSFAWAQAQFKVGDEGFITEGPNTGSKVIILASNDNGQSYDVKYKFDQRIETGMSASSIAVMKGCSFSGLCAGQKVFALIGPRAGDQATIIAIHQDKETYALSFDSDKRVGLDWDNSSIAITKGCTRTEICIGERYSLTRGSRRGTLVHVLGRSVNDELVVRTESDHQIFVDITAADLRN